MFNYLIFYLMEQTFNPDVIIYLVIACAFLFVFAIFAAVFYLKKDKENKALASEFKKRQTELEDVVKTVEEKLKEQGVALDEQSDELRKNNQYNKAMSQLVLEEQKTYLYNVACTLDSYIKKNNLMIENGFISAEAGQIRNAQLLVLKGSLLQYADTLAAALAKEQTKIEEA